MREDAPPLQAFSLQGARACVTGAGGGIGEAIASAFARAGARVALLDIDAAAASSAAEKIPGAVAVPVDVTVEETVNDAFASAEAALGGLDILVNAAGIAVRGPSATLALADWKRVVDVNLTGVFLCARRAARTMREGGRNPSIVNIASIMGLSGGGLYPNASYQASKGGVVNLTRALAAEWAASNIRVNAIAPTWVRTPFIAGLLADAETVARMEAMTPLGRLAEPDDVAAAAVFLASPAASMITGHILAVDGGFLAV